MILPDVGASAWGQFQAGLTPEIDRELLACWSRARQLGAPMLGAPLEDHLDRGEALRVRASHVEVVQALGDRVIERATATLADRHFVTLIADADGVVVAAGGGGQFEDTAKRLRLIEGAAWSERARGTNAIGTAATSGRAVEVHGHAHFGQSYRDLVCYAAPIRAIDGSTIAVLDATSFIANADATIARAVIRAAAAVEELLRLQTYAAAGVSIMHLLGRSLERMRDPAVIVEAPGRVARATELGATLFRGAKLTWDALVHAIERPLELEIDRRRYRVRTDPILAPGGTVLAMLVVFESPATVPLAAPAISPSVALARDPFAAIFAEDATMHASIEWARTLAASDLPVMLLAETGSGKELFATAIHASSPRAHGPMLAINCGAHAGALLESELFGYAPGAFTGADRDGRTGLFHAARGGTLFLDEVAEMSPAMQAALLRVIETNTFRRVGDTRLERTDVRVLCATCRDLPALVASGAFRQDLYYRLKGATVSIPALRQRTDLVALARHLLGDITLSDDAASALAAWSWPGNVRELKSALAVGKLAARGATVIERAHLGLEAAVEPRGDLESVERDALRRAIAESGGNMSGAAKRLGIARSTLYRMLQRFGLRQ